MKGTTLKKKKVFVDCSMCGKHIKVGQDYYSLEIGHSKIINYYLTKELGVNELFVWCKKCHKTDFMKRINMR